MEFKKDFLEKEFKKYYEKNGRVATHVFVHSVRQADIMFTMDFSFPLIAAFKESELGSLNSVFGLPYSEMRSRDADLKFNWEDTKFVAVGNIGDIVITRLKNINNEQ